MSKSAITSQELLSFVFQGASIPWGSATHLQINLHNSDPTVKGRAGEFAPTYGGYAALKVARAAGTFSTGASVTNLIDLQFPQCTNGSDVITHVSVSMVGFTQIIYYGALDVPLIVTAGVQPRFKAGVFMFVEQ